MQAMIPVEIVAMTDIVTRLRERGAIMMHGAAIGGPLMVEAADEIERLTAALEEYGDHKYECTMKDTWQCSCGYTAVLRADAALTTGKRDD
jgi:hypothetical protein